MTDPVAGEKRTKKSKAVSISEAPARLLGMNTQGQFVWFELTTPDVSKSLDFYGEVAGLKTTSMDMGDSKYHMLAPLADEGDLKPESGVIEPREAGTPAHWISYVSVDDVDAKAKEVTELGGTVVVEPTDIPTVGRFSLVKDPEGALFNLFKGTEPAKKLTAFHWNELWSKDADKAVGFYTKLLGLTADAMEMPNGTYHVLKAGENPVGGVMTSPIEAAPPMWLPYIKVDDADAAIDRTKRHGGDVKADAMTVPNVGRFGVVGDNVGAVIGLIAPEAKAE